MTSSKQVNLMRPILLLASLLLSSWARAADDPQTAILGNWLTEPRDGIIQISRTANGLYQGRIVGGNEPGKLDVNNPDASQRGVVLRGQIIMRELKYDGAGAWSGGAIYDPKSGSTYHCKLRLRSDGVLQVRGYIGFSLLGKTQLWRRYAGMSMDLPK